MLEQWIVRKNLLGLYSAFSLTVINIIFMIGIQRGLIENVYLPFQLNKMIVSDDES